MLRNSMTQLFSEISNNFNWLTIYLKGLTETIVRAGKSKSM